MGGSLFQNMQGVSSLRDIRLVDVNALKTVGAFVDERHPGNLDPCSEGGLQWACYQSQDLKEADMAADYS